MNRPYIPRPRWAVCSLMCSLCTMTGQVFTREQWLCELMSCAMYGKREGVA